MTADFSLHLTVGQDPVELGMVVVDDVLYVRAYRGPGSRWFQAAVALGHGQVRIGGVTREVTLSHYTGDPHPIDAAYQAKYGDMVNNPRARAATLRIDPA